MTSNHRGFHGDLLPPEVIRKGVYDLGKVNRVPPSVGIFDSPTRCFIVNQEWWSHIGGMVHLLADVLSWKDAEDESYFAIQEILRFMQGIECMDFQLRQNPADNCILQQTLDGGTTWTDVFDFSLCATIQDKSHQISITNQVVYYQPTFQDIFNNYVANYSGSPDSVYPDLAVPTGDAAAFHSAYCNAVYELVKTACNVAVSFYNEVIQDAQNAINVGTGIAIFALTVIALAGALPTAGASLAALAGVAPLWAAGIAVSNQLANRISNELQQHNIEQFQDTDAQIDVTCFIIASCAAEDNSLACMRNAVSGFTGDPNGQAILDFLKVLFENEATYAAFLEKWNNNKQYAEAGIDLDCPCETWYQLWTWDFAAQGQGETYIDTTAGPFGSFVPGTGWRGGTNENNRIRFAIPLDPAWRIRSIGVNIVAPAGALSRFLIVRPTAQSTTAQVTLNPATGTAGYTMCYHEANLTGYSEILIDASKNHETPIYVDKIAIIYYDNEAPYDAVVTEDESLCS